MPKALTAPKTITADLSPTNQAIVAMHNGGLSTRKIETIIGNLDHNTIARRLKKLTPRKTTEIYKELKSDILAEKQRQLLMQARQADAREQDQISRAFKVYNEAQRLHEDKTTTNVGIGIGCTDEMADLIGSITGKRPE